MLAARRLARHAVVGRPLTHTAALSTTATPPSPDTATATDAVDAVTSTMDGPGIISNAMHAMTWVHDLGLPWWATIAATSLGLRIVVLPLFYRGVVTGAKMAKHQPALVVFQEKHKEAAAEKRTDLIMAVTKERRAYMKEHDIKMSRMFLPLLVQAPLFVTFMITLRRFCNEADVIPGFKEEGGAWFLLHQPDPYYILPLSGVALTVLATRLNDNMRSNTWFTRDQMRRGMTYLSLMFLPISCFLPAAITEYIAITAGTMVVQQITMKSAPFRTWLGLPPEWPHVGKVPARVGTHPLAKYLGPPGEVEAGSVAPGGAAVVPAVDAAREVVEAQFEEPAPVKIPAGKVLTKGRQKKGRKGRK